MKINSRTLEKMVAEIFIHAPIVIKLKTEQDAFLEKIKAALSTDKRILHISKFSGESSREGKYHGISIRLKTLDDSYGFSPGFQFNKDGVLQFTGYGIRKNYPFDSLETYTIFLDKLFVLYKEAEQTQQKTEKINALKLNSIEAKIKEIANEDKFEYACNGEGTKVNVLIKLTNRDALNIHVPYKNFQEVMQQVRPIIKTIRELTTLGIVFKIKGFGYTSWQKPTE